MKSLLCIGMPHAFIVAYSMTGSVEARQTAVFASVLHDSIRHLHRYRLICLHGAEMRAEVLRENSRGVFAQTVGIVTLCTDLKAIV